MTPEYELNEIIWKSVRGADSPMPPPVRAGFVRIIEDDDEEAAGEEAAAEGSAERGGSRPRQ